MKRDAYEIYLLELRQSLTDLEKELRNLGCIDISKFRRVKTFKKIAEKELIAYRIGFKRNKNKEILKLMEG